MNVGDYSGILDELLVTHDVTIKREHSPMNSVPPTLLTVVKARDRCSGKELDLSLVMPREQVTRLRLKYALHGMLMNLRERINQGESKS